MKNFLILSLTFFLVSSVSCQRADRELGVTETQKHSSKTVSETRAVPSRQKQDNPFVKGKISLKQTVVPTGLAVDNGTIFVNDLKEGKIKLFNMNGKMIDSIEVPGALPTALDVRDGIIYYGDIIMKNVLRIKTGDKKGLKPLPFYGLWQKDLAVTENDIIFLDTRRKEIVTTDRYDGSTIRRYKAPGANPTSITYDGRWLYCGESEEKKIHVIEPETGWVIRSIPSPAGHLSGLSFYKGNLYVSDLHDNSIHILNLFPDKPLVESETEKYRVVFTVNNRIEGSGSAKNLRNYIAIPQDHPGQKLISEIKFSPEPDSYVTDKWGQRFAEFKTEHLSPGDTKKVQMSVDVKVSQAAFHFDPDEFRNIYFTGMKEFLSDGRKYMVNSDYITGKTKELIKDETRYYYKARKLYEYLADSITYVREGGWGRADTVIKRGTGSCSEYTFALIALYRSAGIPSRFVGAFVNRSKHGGLDFVFHRWAEIWMGEKYGWVPVDANAGATDEPEKRGNAFGSIPNRYLITTISGGESEYTDWSYNYGVKYDSENGGVVRSFPLARWIPLD